MIRDKGHAVPNCEWGQPPVALTRFIAYFANVNANSNAYAHAHAHAHANNCTLQSAQVYRGQLFPDLFPLREWSG